MASVPVSPVAEFSAAAATVLAAWQLAPQVSKLRRASSTAGLSPTWALVGVVTNGGWAAYRWSQELWFGLPSPVVAAALYAITFLLIGQAMCNLRWALVAAVLWIAALAGAGFAGGWVVLGTLLGLSGGAQAVPSVWAAYRAARPAGIAPSVWVIGVGQAALWGHYGWSAADGALVLYGVTAGAASIAVLSRYVYARRRPIPARAT